MRKSFKQLNELAIATNQNLARIGVIETFKPYANMNSYTIRNANNSIACQGKLSDCISFLYGINWLVSNNLYKPKI
jgi:hypothetical protein